MINWDLPPEISSPIATTPFNQNFSIVPCTFLHVTELLCSGKLSRLFLTRKIVVCREMKVSTLREASPYLDYAHSRFLYLFSVLCFMPLQLE